MVHKGHKSLSPPYTAHKPHSKARDGEFVCSIMFFHHHFQLFSTQHFQLNCQSSHGAAHLPLADKGNKSPTLQSPIRNSLGEGANSEFSLLFISPHHSKLFLTIFPQLNCYPLSHAGHLPSVNKANEYSCCHYPLTRCMEEAAMVSSCPISFLPQSTNQRLFSKLLLSN